jgi:RNA polymerase sigma factor (sigma-70 family)
LTNDIDNLSDFEIIEKLKTSSSYLESIYLKHKKYCLNFMFKLNPNSEENLDIYHDAIITLYEKTCSGNFTLTASIQTYLNSICRNQILNRFSKSKLHVVHHENYDEKITDWIEDDLKEIEEHKLNAIIEALLKIRDQGGNCYEILRRFYYDKHSMEKIASDLDYTNANNVKNQKARCQKKLNQEALEIFNQINV